MPATVVTTEPAEVLEQSSEDNESKDTNSRDFNSNNDTRTVGRQHSTDDCNSSDTNNSRDASSASVFWKHSIKIVGKNTRIFNNIESWNIPKFFRNFQSTLYSMWGIDLQYCTSAIFFQTGYRFLSLHRVRSEKVLFVIFTIGKLGDTNEGISFQNSFFPKAKLFIVCAAVNVKVLVYMT